MCHVLGVATVNHTMTTPERTQAAQRIAKLLSDHGLGETQVVTDGNDVTLYLIKRPTTTGHRMEDVDVGQFTVQIANVTAVR